MFQGVNLCAGGDTGEYVFELPTWISYCEITFENNTNSKTANYLNNLYQYTNNTSEHWLGSGVGKLVTITPKNDGSSIWGAEVSIGSAATTTSFPEVTVSKYAYDQEAVSIKSLGSETASSYYHYVPGAPETIDGYVFDAWFSDDGLVTPYTNSLLLSATSIYAKFNSYQSLADDYGQYFIDNVGCHADGVEDPDGWDDVAAAYPTIPGVRSIICGTDPVIDGTVLERCVYWYKVAITQHPLLTKFMVDEVGDPRTFGVKNSIVMQGKIDENVIVISTVGVVALLSVAGLCFIAKKRREQE